MTTPILPLHCSICPKKPTFSDISHLLTHIASKGHLSHYYKIKVRSGHDISSREVIDAYDKWYTEWNVESLVSDRLALKDRKRAKNFTQGPASRAQKKVTKPNGQSVDPRLSGANNQDFSMLPSAHPLNPALQTPQIFAPPNILPQTKAHRPRLHLWPTHRPTSYDAIPMEFSSPSPQPAHRPAPLAPMMFRANTAFDNDDEDITEATRLKGVYWPGMDLFDAATPEMKRVRNQKKQGSVIRRLERNSFGVEPNEMIFNADGSLWKERPISGQVNFDSSPYKLTQFTPPPPKKRKTRAPLAEKSTNISALPSRRTSTAGPPLGYAPIRTETGPGQKPHKKRKRNFAVYEDQEDQEEQQDNDDTDMKYLTSAFHYGGPVQQRAQRLDGPLAALYQPAYQHGYFAEAFENYHPAMYGLPVYGYYGHAGYDLPGFFSYPPQQNNQEDVEQDGSVEHEQTPGTACTIVSPSDN